MRKFDTLFFDLGGTLIYFDGEWNEVTNQANSALVNHLKEAGLKLDFDAFLGDFMKRLGKYFKRRDTEFIEHTTASILHETLVEWCKSQVSQKLVDSALRAMYKVSQSHWKVEEDAHQTLRSLQEQGYRMAIISNAANDDDVQTLVDNAQLRPYFEFILSSAAVGIRKPDPRIFNLGIELMAAQKSRSAMIGDTLEADVFGAQHSGLYSIWITRRADNLDNQIHADSIIPDIKIQTLAELPGSLKNK
jgi:HAD superfamily hydrolase (TIGR01549 family)